jgi:hypothetical protein
MRNASANVVEKIIKQILNSITFFFENIAFYDVMWGKIVEQGRQRDNMAHILCMLNT